MKRNRIGKKEFQKSLDVWKRDKREGNGVKDML